MSLTQAQILDRVTTLLQDGSYSSTTSKRWTATELRQYLYDAQHEFIRLTEFPIVTSNVTITEAVSTFNRPSSPPLMNLKRARIENTSVEIPIVTSSVLDENRVVGGQIVDSNWQSQTGPIRSIVIEHNSSPTFRVYPTPTTSDHLFSATLVSQIPVFDVTGDSSTDVLSTTTGIITAIVDTSVIKFDGVIDPPRDRLTYNNAQADTDVPLIGSMYQEALVFGVAERAYLKENELRNVEKSGVFRQRFLEMVRHATQSESTNSMTRNSGASKKRVRVGWRWR